MVSIFSFWKEKTYNHKKNDISGLMAKKILVAKRQLKYDNDSLSLFFLKRWKIYWVSGNTVFAKCAVVYLNKTSANWDHELDYLSCQYCTFKPSYAIDSIIYFMIKIPFFKSFLICRYVYVEWKRLVPESIVSISWLTKDFPTSILSLYIGVANMIHLYILWELCTPIIKDQVTWPLRRSKCHHTSGGQSRLCQFLPELSLLFVPL